MPSAALPASLPAALLASTPASPFASTGAAPKPYGPPAHADPAPPTGAAGFRGRPSAPVVTAAPAGAAARAGASHPAVPTGPAAGPAADPAYRADPSDPAAPVCAPDSPFLEVLRFCEAVAKRACPVLLYGESGTGKEVVARYLHARGDRARGPFVAVNCGALPPGLIESELFGHKKGAFTGAAADHPGRFRQAHGGTLFLDEIGDMPPEAQVRLLRALQEKRVAPVGDTREYPVDFRLVCATHRDLWEQAGAGRFREDLLFRLDVVAIALPPLRDRRGDIPSLLRHFLASLLPPAEAESAWRAAPPELAEHPFPGNVRELRNLAERYCVYREMGGGWEAALAAAARGRQAEVPAALPAGAPPPVPSRPRDSRASDAEILDALRAAGHHRGRAAGLLGITRRALQYRLAKMARAPLP